MSLKFLVPTAAVACLSLMQPTLAFADESTTTQKPIIGDGTALQIQELGISITPPVGWEVLQKSSGMSLVMQEQRVEQKKPDYSKPIYQRNITVAAMHAASPIDEKRAEQLKADLMKAFSGDGIVKEYQIIEHKFFNYRGENDGLLVYASMNLGEFRMMQMNVLVSGAEKQFLMTYTDLADSFAAGGAAYDAAWNSMFSMNVTGNPPARYEDLIRYGALSAGIFFLFAIVTIIRRRSAKIDLSDVEENMHNESWSPEETSLISTMAGEWKLTRNHFASEEEDDMYIEEDLPKTRKSSRFSRMA